MRRRPEESENGEKPSESGFPLLPLGDDPERSVVSSELICNSLDLGVAHRVFEQSPLEKLKWNIACHLKPWRFTEITLCDDLIIFDFSHCRNSRYIRNHVPRTIGLDLKVQMLTTLLQK